MAARFFKGTQVDQNVKFKNKEKQLLKSLTFPPSFDQQVNLLKVDMEIIKSWIERRITQLLGTDDEIIISYALEYMDEARKTNQLCPKSMQMYFTGFMEDRTPVFMQELWDLLLEAQTSPEGVPPKLIQEKEKELNDKKFQLAQEKQQISRITQHMVSVQDSNRAPHLSRNTEQKVSSRHHNNNDAPPRKKFDSRERYKSRSRSPQPAQHHRDHRDKRNSYRQRERHDRRERQRSPSSDYGKDRERQIERAKDRTSHRDSDDYYRRGKNYRDDKRLKDYDNDRHYHNNNHYKSHSYHRRDDRQDRRKRSRSQESREKRQQIKNDSRKQ